MKFRSASLDKMRQRIISNTINHNMCTFTLSFWLILDVCAIWENIFPRDLALIWFFVWRAKLYRNRIVHKLFCTCIINSSKTLRLYNYRRSMCIFIFQFDLLKQNYIQLISKNIDLQDLKCNMIYSSQNESSASSPY